MTGRPYRGAAEAWAVSPPALSMQILELENELEGQAHRAPAVGNRPTEIAPASTPRGQTWIEDQKLAQLLAEVNLKLGRPVEGLN